VSPVESGSDHSDSPATTAFVLRRANGRRCPQDAFLRSDGPSRGPLEPLSASSRSSLLVRAPRPPAEPSRQPPLVSRRSDHDSHPTRRCPAIKCNLPTCASYPARIGIGSPLRLQRLPSARVSRAERGPIHAIYARATRTALACNSLRHEFGKGPDATAGGSFGLRWPACCHSARSSSSARLRALR
jgi:hypothetical protein